MSIIPSMHYFTCFEQQQRNIVHLLALALVGDGDANGVEDKYESEWRSLTDNDNLHED